MFFSFVVLVYSQNNVSFLLLVFSLFVSHNPTSIRVRWNVSFTDADNPFTSISNNVLDFFIIMIIIIQHISGASRQLFDFIVDPLQPKRNSIYKEKVTPTNHGRLIFHKDMVGNMVDFFVSSFRKIADSAKEWALIEPIYMQPSKLAFLFWLMKENRWKT